MKTVKNIRPIVGRDQPIVMDHYSQSKSALATAIASVAILVAVGGIDRLLHYAYWIRVYNPERFFLLILMCDLMHSVVNFGNK